MSLQPGGEGGGREGGHNHQNIAERVSSLHKLFHFILCQTFSAFTTEWD